METTFDLPLKQNSSEDNQIRILKEKVGMRNREQDIKNDKNMVMDIPIDSLINNPHQPRLNMDDEKLQELTLSIKTHGVLQPILVSSLDDGRYMIRFGHRRVLASKKAGLETIKAIITKNTDSDAELISEALIENLQRENMHFIDVALSMKKAIDSGAFHSISELAKSIGVDRTYVSKIISALTLPEEVLRDISANNTISDRTVIDILRQVKDETKCIEIYRWYIENSPSRIDLNVKIKNALSNDDIIPKYSIKKSGSGFIIKTVSLNNSQQNSLEEFLKQLLKE